MGRAIHKRAARNIRRRDPRRFERVETKRSVPRHPPRCCDMGVAQDCAGNNGCGLFVSAPMPGILKHKITFDCETSQLHSGTIICPSRQSGRLGLLLLALLAFWRHNGIIDIAPYYPATRNFPTSLRACVNNRRKFPSVEYKAGRSLPMY